MFTVFQKAVELISFEFKFFEDFYLYYKKNSKKINNIFLFT